MNNYLPDSITDLSDVEFELMQQIVRNNQNYRIIEITPKKHQYEIVAILESKIPKNYKTLGLLKGTVIVWLTLNGYQPLTKQEEQELYIKGFETFCKIYNCN